MRIRTAVLCSLTVGATWFGATAASALEIGPVSVPVPVPPVAVTVPPTITAGPVAVPVTQVAPGLGASVTVSPPTGVGATVSLPSSLGPVPALPGAPHEVHVALGPGTGATLSAGGPPVPGMPVGVARGPSPRSTSGALLPSAARSGVHGLDPSAAGLPGANGARPASPASMVPVESQPGAVNASLQHENSGGMWSRLHDLTSANGLWFALLLIVAIARFAAGGLLRDAFRRRAHLSST